MKILAERLKALRTSVGFTQVNIANLIGVPQGSVARYELGSTNPTPETLLWYADYFDVSMDYIFGRTDDPKGRLYGNKPQHDPQMDRFIEMCFEPGTNANARLKDALLKILEEGRNADE